MGVASPNKFAHVVLRTSQFAEQLTWWTTVLEAKVRYGNDFIAFLSYDDEHHRVAIVQMPELADGNRKTAGVEHVAYTMASLDDLLDHYSRLAAIDIKPYWTINHGMTLSAYYRDPDQNQVEFQVDLCSLAEADTFMRSPAFAANPIGIDVDFDDLITRKANGEDEESLTAYVPA